MKNSILLQSSLLLMNSSIFFHWTQMTHVEKISNPHSVANSPRKEVEEISFTQKKHILIYFLCRKTLKNIKKI